MPHKGCARVLPTSLGNGWRWPIKLGCRMEMCDPSTAPTHCGTPYLCSKNNAISSNFSAFGHGMNSGRNRLTTEEQNSCT
ncbi:hypothetical protein JOQ06_015691, partial [Pogonophryne albipinna]